MEEVERLIREEAQREGSISFARFMERALLEPGLGYYATVQRRAGRSGDFMTAPELHPILGAAIAQLAAATWERLGRPATFRWRDWITGTQWTLNVQNFTNRIPPWNSSGLYSRYSDPRMRYVALSVKKSL